nr:unnamed protein product [Callosobruchus analis]
MATIRHATIQETKENLHAKGLIKPQATTHTAAHRPALTGLSINTQGANVHKNISKKCDTFAKVKDVKEVQLTQKQSKPDLKPLQLRKEESKGPQLTLQKVSSQVLQLLLIASKYEEMYLPSLSDFEYLCDGAFTSKQILQMEIDILKRLDFNLGYPPAIQFLKRYSKVMRSKADHYTMSKYFLELALLEHTLSSVKPSLLAAAGVLSGQGGHRGDHGTAQDLDAIYGPLYHVPVQRL